MPALSWAWLASRMWTPPLVRTALLRSARRGFPNMPHYTIPTPVVRRIVPVCSRYAHLQTMRRARPHFQHAPQSACNAARTGFTMMKLLPHARPRGQPVSNRISASQLCLQIQADTRTLFGWPPVAVSAAHNTARAYIAAQVEAWIRNGTCAEVTLLLMRSC